MRCSRNNAYKRSRIEEKSKILKVAVKVCERRGRNMEVREGRTSFFREVLRMF